MLRTSVGRAALKRARPGLVGASSHGSHGPCRTFLSVAELSSIRTRLAGIAHRFTAPRGFGVANLFRNWHELAL